MPVTTLMLDGGVLVGDLTPLTGLKLDFAQHQRLHPGDGPDAVARHAAQNAGTDRLRPGGAIYAAPGDGLDRSVPTPRHVTKGRERARRTKSTCSSFRLALP